MKINLEKKGICILISLMMLISLVLAAGMLSVFNLVIMVVFMVLLLAIVWISVYGKGLCDGVKL